jgi:hypothetical protein
MSPAGGPSMKRNSRTAANLSDSVHHQLSMYAFAASAAGMSMYGLAYPAEAKIVYTPATVRISPNSTINLDLNHDGIEDFKLSAFYVLQSTGHAGTGALVVLPPGKNAVVQAQGSALALPAGFRIGPGGHRFAGGFLFMAAMFRTNGSLVTWGPWAHVKNRYLGLKFQIKGQTHFGWARLSTKIGFGGATGVLTGYAYETIPNKAIITGKTHGTDEEPALESLKTRESEPPTLGVLAMGAPGLSIWRRKESALQSN